MYIHVNFNIEQQCNLFNQLFNNTAQSYIDKGISDIIFEQETGDIICQIKHNTLQYMDTIQLPIKNIEELQWI